MLEQALTSDTNSKWEHGVLARRLRCAGILPLRKMSVAMWRSAPYTTASTSSSLLASYSLHQQGRMLMLSDGVVQQGYGCRHRLLSSAATTRLQWVGQSHAPEPVKGMPVGGHGGGPHGGKADVGQDAGGERPPLRWRQPLLRMHPVRKRAEHCAARHQQQLASKGSAACQYQAQAARTGSPRAAADPAQPTCLLALDIKRLQCKQVLHQQRTTPTGHIKVLLASSMSVARR